MRQRIRKNRKWKEEQRIWKKIQKYVGYVGKTAKITKKQRFWRKRKSIEKDQQIVLKAAKNMIRTAKSKEYVKVLKATCWIRDAYTNQTHSSTLNSPKGVTAS